MIEAAQIDLEEYLGVARTSCSSSAQRGSTRKPRANSSAGQKLNAPPSGSATKEVDPAIREIERKRKQLGLRQADLLVRANVSRRAYEMLLSGVSGRAQRETLQRLRAALKGPKPEPRRGASAAVVFGACLAVVCAELDLDTETVRAHRPYPVKPKNPAWLAAADARRLALYLANTLGDVRQCDLAATVSMTKAAVCIACRQVEASRDHPGFDAVVAACEQKIGGTG